MSIYNLSPMELVEKLSVGNFMEEIPSEIKTFEDLNKIANVLPTIVNKYAYLMEVSSHLKIMIRQAKREHKTQLAEDLIDKQNAVTNALEVLKLQQKTLSRLITIKQMENEELGMY